MEDTTEVQFMLQQVSEFRKFPPQFPAHFSLNICTAIFSFPSMTCLRIFLLVQTFLLRSTSKILNPDLTLLKFKSQLPTGDKF